MSAQMITDTASDLLMRSCIQKVATGPEFSKNLSYDEAHAAMRHILDGTADPVQAAVLLIALRMKRETDAENTGVLQAILDTMTTVTAEVDEVLVITSYSIHYTKLYEVRPGAHGTDLGHGGDQHPGTGVPGSCQQGDNHERHRNNFV